MTPRILIVAGSDSGGGAGIQVDIKTVTMLGGHAMTAITAITAQNTLGVQAVHPVPVNMVVAQMRSMLDDIGADAVKIGMIGSAETAHAVADVLEQLAVPVVFDPVMVATSGAVLADAATIAAFERLMALASVVTPNVAELQALAGGTGEDEAGREAMAAAIVAQHGVPVLAKGGDADGVRIADLLVTGAATTRWFGERVDTLHTHGTGCTLASAIATGLGGGLSLDSAIDRGIAYVRRTITSAPGFGGGHGPMGHSLGRVPFYDALAATDADGYDAAAFAARWT